MSGATTISPEEFRRTAIVLSNEADAQLYVQTQQLRARRIALLLFALSAGSLAVYGLVKLLTVRALNKGLIDFVDSSGWRERSGLSVALASAWNWYNLLFGNDNPVFATCVQLAWNSRVYRCLVHAWGDPAAFLDCLWKRCQGATNSNQSALQILCSVFQVRDPDSAAICETPCPGADRYAQNDWLAAATSGLGGMAAGAGAGLAFHGIGAAAAEGAAAGSRLGVGFAVAGLVVGALSGYLNNQTARRNDSARCKNQAITQHCYLPQGACP